MSADILEIPARSGVAVDVLQGTRIRVINTHGSQVIDTWAFSDDMTEFMSMEHTRVMLGKISPQKGDSLFSNRRRPLLKMVEDTSPGVHDTLRAACDQIRYELLGFTEHASCENNLKAALQKTGRTVSYIPCPLNMFESCPVDSEGKLVVVPPPVKAGDYVDLLAEVDVTVVFSACPMDVFPTNGPDCTPKPAGYQLLR